MKRILLTAALVILATPALAKEYTVKEVSDPAGPKPYYFVPDKLTIQPGDTVTFVDAQEDMHDVMFDVVPKAVTDGMIMGPMQKEEGSKWSYKFTVPGTYHFHCHPHEALGMKGDLIVGAPSKPGETRNVDHDAMTVHTHDKEEAHDQAATGLAEATGKINSIDVGNHSINVSHDPIKALGWPKMKMEFSVDKSIDLSGFKTGDAISFTLKAVGNDDYTVVKLKKGQ